MIVYFNLKLEEIPNFNHYRVPCIDVIELFDGKTFMKLDSITTRWDEKTSSRTHVITANYEVEMNLCEDNGEYEPVANEKKYLKYLRKCKISEIQFDFADEDVIDYKILNKRLDIEICSGKFFVNKRYTIKAE